MKITKIIRTISFLAVIALLLPCLIGCGGNGKKDDKLTVLCTVFPIYDWVCELVGDAEGIDVELLVTNGTDLHSYEPTAADMAKILGCDMIVYVGGESDSWVKKALESNKREDRAELSLIEYEEITKHTISDEHLAEQSDDHDHSHEDGVIDEHIWLSPKNALVACEYIKNELCALNEENTEKFESSFAAYAEKLGKLDEKFEELQISEPIIFADRFPFIYLCEDYGISYYAAFDGCTTEADADFETVIRLASIADEYSTKYLFVTENSDRQLANAIADAREADTSRILALDSMQSVNSEKISSGVTYISIMEKNLSVLKDAFS